MSEHLLDVRNLRVSFHTYAGEVKAVRGVSFWLDAGETLAIVGESGCGKSVTVQTIMKLLPSPPARIKDGAILYQGRDITRLTDKEMENYRGKEFSMIFQDSMTSLNPTMRVGRQMCEGILRHRKASREEAKHLAIELLGQVGLPNPEQAYRRYPHTMSGGQRQRVMIAMAIACNPKILFADEPTTALDVTMQAQILDLVNGLKARLGTSVLLITHDLGVVAKMADRIAVMYAGKVVEYGDARQVFYRPCHPYTWGLLGAMPNLIQDVKSELYAIPGTPPDLYSPPQGCAFAARCPYAMEACLKEDAPEFSCGEGHSSRCWLLDQRSEPVMPPEGIPELPRGGAILE
ncbi:oligopeptide transporter subunit; ATP-binding component of ABC superfamily [uncultured Eubacteriales bacterium]|uniref:Oligopeptide transporter subunit ATP-binding component of ABC superfamily n=1 Tax=uncultured Eubacteriales bacterium TaxID=172733 RepID=A0A212KGR6_9FIRM|nr:oligopeptide transporter subunit; ATP-binding component of ABC superfamily [uncultured Eubacteriales bacterium]